MDLRAPYVPRRNVRSTGNPPQHPSHGASLRAFRWRNSSPGRFIDQSLSFNYIANALFRYKRASRPQQRKMRRQHTKRNNNKNISAPDTRAIPTTRPRNARRQRRKPTSTSKTLGKIKAFKTGCATSTNYTHISTSKTLGKITISET